MVMLAASLLLAASAQPATVLGRVWPGTAAKQVRGCGFGNVAIWYDRTLDNYAIVISGTGQASEAQLTCVARVSLATDYSVDLPEPIARRYDGIYWPMAEEAGRRHAREWLKRHGLLDKLPPYRKGRTDELAYARKLERICGPRANGAFELDRGVLTLRTTSPAGSEFDPATLACLSNALWASGLPTGLLGSVGAD